MVKANKTVEYFMKKLFFYLLTFLFLSMPALAGVSKQDFENITTNFELKMQLWVKKNYGKKLIVTSDWDKEWDERSSGGSFYFPNFQWGLHITGWLARHEAIDSDSLYFVLCHELGHHVYGGAKERQADYFAAKVCLPMLWKKGRKKRILASFERVQLFRKWIWEKASFSEERISWISSCRRSVVIQGLLNLPFVDCPSSKL